MSKSRQPTAESRNEKISLTALMVFLLVTNGLFFVVVMPYA